MTDEGLEPREEIDLIHDWLGVTTSDPLLSVDKEKVFPEPTFEHKATYLQKWCALDNTHMSGEDMLTLISLVNMFVVAKRKTAPETTPLQILNTILGHSEMHGDNWVRERVALMCGMFLTPNSKFRSFGLTTKEEIIAEIKRLVGTWIPF